MCSTLAEQDLLKRTTNDIRARLKELEPLVREHEQLQRALTALEASGKQTSTRRARGGGNGRGRRTTTSRAGRGERRQQLLRVLQAEPGRRPSEVARHMGINPSQLHPLARKLEEQGEIERRDGGLYLAAVQKDADDPGPPEAA